MVTVDILSFQHAREINRLVQIRLGWNEDDIERYALSSSLSLGPIELGQNWVKRAMTAKDLVFH